MAQEPPKNHFFSFHGENDTVRISFLELLSAVYFGSWPTQNWKFKYFDVVKKLNGGPGVLSESRYSPGKFRNSCGYLASLVYNNYKLLTGLPHLDLLNKRPLRKERYDTFPDTVTAVPFTI